MKRESNGGETEEKQRNDTGRLRVLHVFPAGGIHLKRTGEISEIYLKRKNPIKGKERIEIYLSEHSI